MHNTYIQIRKLSPSRWGMMMIYERGKKKVLHACMRILIHLIGSVWAFGGGEREESEKKKVNQVPLTTNTPSPHPHKKKKKRLIGVSEHGSAHCFFSFFSDTSEHIQLACKHSERGGKKPGKWQINNRLAQSISLTKT